MKITNTFYGFVLVLALQFLTYHVQAQESDGFNNIIGKLATYVEKTPPDKVYLQTDKDFYANGETIWFKTYVLDGITHLESLKSKVVYVELLDSEDKIIEQRKLYAGFNGAAGDIMLSKDLEEGSYLLRAYTNYMLNDSVPTFFQKEIPVWNLDIDPNSISENEPEENRSRVDAPKNGIRKAVEGKPIVQFFPEGGHLVAGLKNVMGLKITDAAGAGIALRGNIVDAEGRQIAPFRSFEFGLASVNFEVESNSAYYAQIEINGVTEKYLLPKPLTKGYVLQLTNHGGHLVVRVSTNIPNGLEGSLLLGHLRGSLIFNRLEKSGTEASYVIKLSTGQLDDGVAHFTLFAPNGEPVCERLTFIENPKNKVKLSIKTDKTSYGFREEVALSLGIEDGNGKTLDGRFSMSVSSQNSLESATPTIKSWLLLNSDLGGTVENPNYFFEDDSKARDYVLDLLMLTHGWRRFVWKSFMTEGVSKEMEFQPEKGIMISGTTTDFDNPFQPLRTVVTLNALAGNVHQENILTNMQGKFSFGPFMLRDTVETIIKAELFGITKKGTEKIGIQLDAAFPKVKASELLKRPLDFSTKYVAEPYLREVERKQLNDFKYDPKAIRLDEAVVKAKLKTRKQVINEKLSSRTLYGDARRRIIPDSLANNLIGGIFDLLVGVPGVQVLGFPPEASVIIRGGLGPPLYLLDGAEVGLAFVQYMPVAEILFMDVLVGPEAAIYGVRGAGGVIAIYTKTGENFDDTPEIYPGIINLTVPGFYKTREFFAPNHTVSKPKLEKPDYRITLDWKPNINMEQNNSPKLNFYTSDTSGTYVVRIEGITDDGKPVSARHTFYVDEDL